MVNLKDIAQRLNVSVSTVSRALNDSSEISDAMKQRISAVAEEMGYSLQRKSSRAALDWTTAGIIVPEVTSEYYAKLVHLAKDAFAEHGYSTILKVTNFKPSEMITAISSMVQFHVRCLLIVLDAEENISEQLSRAMQRCPLPIMLITSRHYPLLDFDCIHLDEYSGILMGIRHLQQRGYRRIGFIGEKLSSNRHNHFRQAMTHQELPMDPALDRIGNERAEEGGYLRMKELLALETPPDAVFCDYDQMAIGAIAAIHEAGLRIPQDIAILGFDDTTVARYIEGGISTIGSPFKDMIDIAISVLLKREKNRRSARQQIALRPKLIPRHTT